MSDKEKFEGFKKEYIINNEKQYGKEIREKYGEEAVENSYLKFKKLSAEDYKKLKTIEEKLFKTLLKAMDENDPANSTAQTCAKLHKEWLLFFWDFYTEEAHAQLAQMYVDDERFTKYYDKVKPGAAIFLRDAIHIYTKKRQ